METWLRFTHVQLFGLLGFGCLVLAGCGVSSPTAPQIRWATPAGISYGTALGSAQLDATASVAGVFVYTPAAGTVLAPGSHMLSVSFTPNDTANYTTATATVAISVVQATPVITWPTPAPITYGTPLTGLQLNATVNIPGTSTYSPGLGAVLPVGSQKLSVSFTPNDTANYTTGTATVAISVVQATPVIIWPTPAPITYGTPLTGLQLNATVNIPGTSTYSPGLGAVLPVSSQKLSVSFTPTDATDYTNATAAVTLSIGQAGAAITWPTPAAITYGTALTGLQLNANAAVPGIFTYSPGLGAVLTAGSQTLSVSFTPTDATDYASATASVTLQVNKAKPQIVWVPSASISVGSALGPDQLDAFARAPNSSNEVAGSFDYSPGAGTVVTSSGPKTLNVQFSPADNVDYTSASASIPGDALSYGLVAWGDSLTSGDEGYYDQGAYPAELGNLIVLAVVNDGVRGQTTTQIGVREGGVPTYATVAGGVIPGSGGVTVTFPTGYEPVTIDGPAAGTSGTILGVHGVVTLDSGVYTFSPTTPGSAVSAPGSPKFVVDTPYATYLPVFWEGRNNYNNPPQILSDLAAQVATVPSYRDYLVMSDTNDNRQDEWIGGVGYQLIVSVNNQLASTYGSHYLDIRKVLVNSYDPNLNTDVSDFKHDEVPTSLRAVFTQGATLGNAIGPSDTTFTINTDMSVGPTAILHIDSGDNAENVCVTAVNGDAFTVIRNFGGNDTSHAAGAPVVAYDPVHLNAKGDQIVADAVADYLPSYKSP